VWLLHARHVDSAHALLTDEPDADADRIRSVLSGNLCRCTGYIPIVDAVLEARAAYRKTDKP
jgi:carbon-monoxide dehydrogenase small subunit